MTEDKNKKPPQDSIKLLLGLILIVLAWNSWKILEIGGIAAKVDKYNQGVVDEMGKMMGNVKSFSGDLNEIRRFLLLPEKDYFPEDIKEPELGTEEQIGSEHSRAAFAFLDTIVKEEKAEQNKVQVRPVFAALLANADFRTKIGAAQLGIGEQSDLQVKFIDMQKVVGETQENPLFNQPLYQLVFAADENAFKIQSALGEEVFRDYTSQDFSARLGDYLIQNLSGVRDKKVAEKKTAEDAAVQAKTAAESQLALQKKELEDIVRDKAFAETLATVGLKAAEKPREENNKYIFDVVDAAGKVKFSLALEISSGMIKVIRGLEESDIKNFLESDGSKKKP
jgi:hypothetical protein